MADLGRIIRHIRKSRNLTTTAFGHLLGVTHSQISRYESSQAVPGIVPLARLLQLAEGADKNPIRQTLAGILGKGGAGLSEVEVLQHLRTLNLYTEPLWGSLPLPPAAVDSRAWDDFREFTPNLAGLLEVISALCDRRREVDASLVHFFQLWLSHDDTDPQVRQCFADAVKFVEMALLAKTSKNTQSTEDAPAPPKRKRTA